MLTKEEIIKKIEADLKDDEQTRNALINLWEQTDAGSASDNLPEAQMTTSANGNVGLPTFFCYNNYQAQAYNTCGQAVIGSYLDHFNKNPFGLSKTYHGHDGKMHYDPNQLLSKVFNEFGPNWPWQNGVTVRETILNAFGKYGLNRNEWHPGAFSNGQDSKQQLVNWISQYNLPVIVLIDAGAPMIGGSAYTLHWCVVYGFNDSQVFIATWEKVFPVSWKDFMDAWHCWFLPYPNNYYQIRAWG